MAEISSPSPAGGGRRRSRAGRRRAAVRRPPGDRGPRGRGGPRGPDRRQPGGVGRSSTSSTRSPAATPSRCPAPGWSGRCAPRPTSPRRSGETVTVKTRPAGARRPPAPGRAGGRRRRRASTLEVEGTAGAGPAGLRRHRPGPHRLRLGPRTARGSGKAGRHDRRGARPTTSRGHGRREEEAGRNPMSKPNFEFLDALGQIARDKGISVETLLDALANALVAAYKRRPDAAEEAVVTIDPESGEIRVYGQELDEDGNVIREWDDTPDDFGRIAAQTAKQVILQRIREVERDLKYEEYAGPRGRHRHRHRPADRQPLHPARPGQGGGAAAPGRAGLLRALRARRPPEGLHRRGPQDHQGPPDRGQPQPSGPDQAALRARGPRDLLGSGGDQGRRPRARATARRSPCGRTTPTSTRSAPAWAPGVRGSAW